MKPPLQDSIDNAVEACREKRRIEKSIYTWFWKRIAAEARKDNEKIMAIKAVDTKHLL